MARSQEEQAALVEDFILRKMPRWPFHPNVLRKLGLELVRIAPLPANRGEARYYKSVQVVMLNSNLCKFRHASPYTAPKGKTDISPIGVLSHELGHVLWAAVAHTKKGSELITEWSELHCRLHRDAISSYAKTHYEEDFAEAHRLFVLNRPLLRKLSPERYDLVKRFYEHLFKGIHPWVACRLSAADFRKQWRSVTSDVEERTFPTNLDLQS